MRRVRLLVLAACALASVFVGASDEPAPADVARTLQDAFIWRGVSDTSAGYTVFRKTFSASEVGTASLAIFADARYVLWINGRYVLRGPCSFDPSGPEYDIVDVAPYLTAGSNTLAVLVLSFPAGTNGKMMHQVPGLAATLTAGAGTSAVTMRTDSLRKCKTDLRYAAPAVKWGFVNDTADARRDDGDWTQPGYDDTAWNAAASIAAMPWGPLRARSIPLLCEQEVAVQEAAAFPLEFAEGQVRYLTLPRMVSGYYEIDATRVKFLTTWVTKNLELIDQYQPDMMWFDMNGGDRCWDLLKVRLAGYYYNRAAAWGKSVAISAKGESFLAGMVMDYERQGRGPKTLTDFTWQPDDPITDKFGYVEGQPVKPASGIVPLIVTNVSRNGNYLLNISPKTDGTILDEQQQVLLAIGRWLKVNGNAIYGTRPWKISEEGRVHFTTKSDTLYAISLAWPAGELVIPALGESKTSLGKIEQLELLGHRGALEFTRDAAGLHMKLPAEKACDFAYALKISGPKL